MSRVLIVDDEESVRKVLKIQLKREGHEPFEARDGQEALDLMSQEKLDAVITDMKMPRMDGLDLLQKLRKSYPHIPVIMITAHGTIDTAVEAMKRGAFDYVTKPFDQTELLKILGRALKSSEEMSKEFQRSRSFLRQEDRIIGKTQEMEKVYAIIERVCQQPSNVLITGEPGTGKEVVVRLLHDQSLRRERPLIRAYTSTCVAHQMDEYLFGTDDHPGRLELAEDGTLYIDEISLLPMTTQGKLYEILTSGSFLDSKGRERQIEFRMVTASDFDILEKVENGQFRKDLFYTLNVVPIFLPPLRERTQDIEPLADYFMSVFSKKFSKKVSSLHDEALYHLIEYPWPGNIRELENTIEYAVNVTDSPMIEKSDLPPHIFSDPDVERLGGPGQWKERLLQKVHSLEKEAIEEALRSSGGDVLKASQKLGVPPSLLEEKVENLHIQPLLNH